ncbi:hypothetical protein [Paenibacillus woosongensis]|uniref:Uncharacterized protein n=1 Tax=Paenibacillus woosongensis TaxID=307580 RepID=A0A7X2YZ49_9BACL|nr:hypothetical protein [Paenibacillus woosongensis]MUG44527.1 hypothetical protein [Paenibacillus woosongensis]
MLIQYLNKCILFMLIAFTLSACGHASENAAGDNAASAPDEGLIHLVKANDVIISASKHTDSDVFRGLTVQAGQVSKYFDWTNVTNKTYYPAVHIADINRDEQHEIIIILTTSYGTGMNEQEIHVLSKEDLSELSLEDPLQAIKDQVTSAIQHEQNQVRVSVTTDTDQVEQNYLESDAVLWNEEVSFGSFIGYSAADGVITATVPGSVSPAAFAVNAILEYGSDLRVRSISLEPIE